MILHDAPEHYWEGHWVTISYFFKSKLYWLCNTPSFYMSQRKRNGCKLNYDIILSDLLQFILYAYWNSFLWVSFKYCSFTYIKGEGISKTYLHSESKSFKSIFNSYPLKSVFSSYSVSASVMSKLPTM